MIFDNDIVKRTVVAYAHNVFIIKTLFGDRTVQYSCSSFINGTPMEFDYRDTIKEAKEDIEKYAPDRIFVWRKEEK